MKLVRILVVAGGLAAVATAGGALDEARAAFAAERYEKVVELCAAVGERERAWADATVLKGEALVRLRRLDEADAAFDAVLARKKRHLDARVGKARVLNQRQKHDEAETILRAVLKKKKNHLGALQELGGMLAAIGRGGEARTLMLRAWKLDKTSLVSAQILFEIHLTGYNDRASARKIARAIVKAHPDEPDGYDMDARVLAAEDKTAEVRKRYAKAAAVCHDGGRRDAALRYYGKYVEAGGDDEAVLARYRELQAAKHDDR